MGILTVGPPREAIPGAVAETLEWLVHSEHFVAARSLVDALSRWLPVDHPEVSDYLAWASYKGKSYPEAAKWAENTLAVLPNSSAAMFNLARCLARVGRFAESRELLARCLRDADQEAPQDRETWLDTQLELAVVMLNLGRIQESRELNERILAECEPGSRRSAMVEFNLAWHFLRDGDFQAGIQRLQGGRVIKCWGNEPPGAVICRPLLSAGADLRGKTVLVVGEAGNGDELINCRFARRIASRGAKVIWRTNHDLKGLLGRVDGIAEVIRSPEMPPSFDYWIPCMDLPIALELSAEELEPTAYLKADPALEAQWARTLEAKGKGDLKIGLRWKGNSYFELDLLRSIRLAELAPAVALSGAALFSLQRDEGVEELAEAGPTYGIDDLSGEMRDWEQTAAIIANMDLVITTCTSIAHLSAGLGRPTWVLCPFLCYYVWALSSESEKSPWYESARLFRQERSGDWKAVLRSIRAELPKWLARRSRAPIAARAADRSLPEFLSPAR